MTCLAEAPNVRAAHRRLLSGGALRLLLLPLVALFGQDAVHLLNLVARSFSKKEAGLDTQVVLGSREVEDLLHIEESIEKPVR